MSSQQNNESTEYLKIRVVDQDYSETIFRVKKSIKMGKLKKTYCEKRGVAADSLRFFFEGQRITDDTTPKILEMNDGDAIEVFQHQDGGYYHF